MIGPTFMKLGRAPAMQAIFIVSPALTPSSVGVHPVVVVPERAALDALPPGTVFHVPRHRVTQTRFERDPGSETRAFGNFLRGHGVAAIVPGAIGHELEQIARLPERGQDAIRNLENVVLVPGRDIEDLSFN